MKSLILFSLAAILAACTSTKEFQTLETSPVSGNSVELTVHGMSCPLCSNNLDGRLEKIDGVETMTVDLNSGAVTVELADGHNVTRQQLATAVQAAGFTLAGIEEK